MTDAMREALKWLRDRGGTAAIAKTRSGGRIYLAQGDQGMFAPVTIKRLCAAGLAEVVLVGVVAPSRKAYRLQLTEAGKAMR